MTGQNWTDWKPKPRQRRLLEAAQKAGLNRSILTVCDESKVSRSTFYYWMANDSGFADAWDKVWRKTIKHHLPSIVAALVSKGRKGDVPAARLVADMAGAVKQIHEVTSTDETTIRLTWDDDNAEPDTSEAP